MMSLKKCKPDFKVSHLTFEICLRQNPLTSWVRFARFDTMDRFLQLPL